MDRHAREVAAVAREERLHWRWSALLLALALAQPAAAQGEGGEGEADGAAEEADPIPKTGLDGRNPRVDRLSEHLGAGLSGPVPDGFDALVGAEAPPAEDPTPAEGEAPPAEGDTPDEAGDAAEDPAGDPTPAAAAPTGVTVVEAMVDVPDPAAPDTDRVRFIVETPAGEPRLLLVDAGPVWFTPDGAAWLAVPNQRGVASPPKTAITVDLLPLRPEQDRPAPGDPLTAAMTADPALLAVLRTVQRIEANDVARLRRYVKRDGETFTVKTFVRNEDVRVAAWMEWRAGPGGRPVGTLPRDAVRMAIYAVTAGYTIQDIADWLRTRRAMDMEPAIEAARTLARQSEFILERAGLEYRILSPRHAEFMYNQGVDAFEVGELERAEKHFRAAIESRPEMLDAHYNLGVTLYRAGKYEEASSAFLIASGIEGAPARVFFNRGATLYRLDDQLGAARQFRKALAAGHEDPERVQAWIDKTDPEGKTAPPPPEPKKKRRRRRRSRR